jgi:hypothetical protein
MNIVPLWSAHHESAAPTSALSSGEAMIRRSLIAGGVADWARALHVVDRARRLPLREMNFLLDQIIVSQDAEREARAAAIERLRKPTKP